MRLNAGEVHALVGENGAGKSTLMKILSGVYQKDAGTIEIRGKQVEIGNTKHAQALGISIIHQELNLMKHLTAAQNIFIGREHSKKFPFLVDDQEINEKTKSLFEMIHLDLDPRVKISELTVAKQQMVEIAKALSFNMDVLIMDEPTSALSDSEIEDLFRVIRNLRDQGKGIVYISHRMDELKLICDSVTVMRDGKYIDTNLMKDMTTEKIISRMVGREIYETAHIHGDAEKEDVVLEVKGLSSGKKLRDVSFKLHKGEILGFAGLLGAGRTETARAIFGADPIDSGEIYVKGEKVSIRHPKDAVKYGIGYLSEDRKQFGLALGLSVETNTVMASLEKYVGPLGIVDERRTRQTAQEYVERLQTKRAEHRPEDAQSLRRQPAESGYRQMAGARLRHPHLRRADEGNRRRRQERDLQAAQRACRPRQVDHHDLFGIARNPAHEPPRRGHVRRTDNRHAASRRVHAGIHHAFRHDASVRNELWETTRQRN